MYGCIKTSLLWENVPNRKLKTVCDTSINKIFMWRKNWKATEVKYILGDGILPIFFS